MAVLLDVNTDELKTAVSIARKANEQLTDAMEALNRIVIHTDWECAERDDMNENTSRNRRDIGNIQENCETLYSNICYAADCFCNLEQEVASSFGTIEGPLSSFISLIPQNSPSIGHSPASNFMKDINSALTRNQALESLKVFKNDIDIVSFKDIASSFSK